MNPTKALSIGLVSASLFLAATGAAFADTQVPVNLCPILQVTLGIRHLPATGGPSLPTLFGGPVALAVAFLGGGLLLRRRQA